MATLHQIVIEILLILIMGLMMAHRKGGYPAKGRYSLRPVQTTPTITVGALALSTAVTGTCYGNADGAYRIIALKGTWSLTTNTAGNGPLVVGFCHGDYTVTEIKEFIESTSSISIGNKILGEQANRLIRRVGVFNGLTTDESLNDGMPIKTRLNWAIPIGTNLNMFAYNDDASNRDTGSFVKFNGTGWVKDY